MRRDQFEFATYLDRANGQYRTVRVSILATTSYRWGFIPLSEFGGHKQLWFTTRKAVVEYAQTRAIRFAIARAVNP